MTPSKRIIIPVMGVPVKDASRNAPRASTERNRPALRELAVRISEADLVPKGFGRSGPIVASYDREYYNLCTVVCDFFII